MSETLTGLLMGADPIANRATADGLTIRGLLDAAAERVQKELADQPEAQAEIFRSWEGCTRPPPLRQGAAPARTSAHHGRAAYGLEQRAWHRL